MDALRQQFPADNFSLLAIILLLPLAGAFVSGVFGKRLGHKGVRAMALSAVGGSFFACLVSFALLATTHGADSHHGARLSWTAWRWFSVDGGAASVPIDVAFTVDALSGVMMLVVTGVGFLIHLYSTAYMAKDPGYYRFFAYLNLFVFSMLVLILGDNLAVLFVGWEGVGLCSYLLIGFWFEDDQKAAAGKKAFITNRIGDFGLLVAIAMLIYYAGTLKFSALEAQSSSLQQVRQLWPLAGVELPRWLSLKEPLRASVPTLVALALFLGCVGKSAQIPLYVWLPDAMAGPTPVSALIHAATMVTAGVYLVARTSFIFALSPLAMAVVAGTGALTALFAATIAFAQTDLKKVLAYSTVSQLGFMFVGVGSGAFDAGFFHVVTHAFFKGCLFLCAGSVIHAMHHGIHDETGAQDMRNMGGLHKHLPVTHATFLISCLAIAGCPWTSGFFSKDEILFRAYTSSIAPSGLSKLWVAPPWFGKAVYALSLLAAVGTAFYMFRAYFLTFWGDFKGWRITKKKKAPHESPWPMTLPLVILAALALFAGLGYATPIHLTPLERFWQPVFAAAVRHVAVAPGAEALMWPLLLAGSGAFLVGVLGAWWVYIRAEGKPAAAFARAWPRFHQLVVDKWRIDELYEATVIGFVDALGDTAAAMDQWLIDGVIAKLTAAFVRFFGAALSALQTGRVQVYAAGMVVGTAAIGWFVLMPRAAADVDDTRLRATGEVSFTAAPGHGYSYRWYEGPQEGAFTDSPNYQTRLDVCQTKTVHLQVRSAFGTTAETTFKPCRERGNGCCEHERASRRERPEREVVQ